MTTISSWRRWRFLIDHWWLIYGASVVWSLMWIIAYSLFRPDALDEVIFYPFVEDALVIWCIGATLIGFIAGAILFGLKKKSILWFAVSFAFSLLSWIGCMTILGFALGRVSNTWEPDPMLHHVESEFVGGNVYQFANHEFSPGVIGEAFILYACDRLGLICHAIYRYKPNSMESAVASATYPAELSVEAQSVVVNVGGSRLHLSAV